MRRAGELRAADDAIPTQGSAEAVQACHDTGRPVVIVSNKSAPAIEAYLQLHEVDGLVVAIVGRPPGRPDLMKPHPEPVQQVLEIVAAPGMEGVLIGGSLTDMDVAHATGVHSIG
ncbi:HAD family hydrolase [Actinopolymorpha rutila]|uniref:Phosphoglycolate phosphatase-like HAD superfamily hydrolase n=1 Tax=Actinopolymorpha rutila TaxID=446787 RepID=A0A852ZJY2_9ACTN|nr:HAD hydrolase-like protein [Actinopolymorpha rutila]NYH93294.1 phosphoglycolate phosphatase-like HAD superfamily hydrolase [Actinopolymorpha rutila]